MQTHHTRHTLIIIARMRCTINYASNNEQGGEKICFPIHSAISLSEKNKISAKEIDGWGTNRRQNGNASDAQMQGTRCHAMRKATFVLSVVSIISNLTMPAVAVATADVVLVIRLHQSISYINLSGFEWRTVWWWAAYYVHTPAPSMNDVITQTSTTRSYPSSNFMRIELHARAL